MDPQTEQGILEAGKDDCQTPRRSQDKAYLQLESSDISGKQGRPVKGREDDLNAYLQPARTNRDPTIDTTGLTTAQHGLKWDSMESDTLGGRRKQTTRPTSSITTTTTKPTTHEQTKYASPNQSTVEPPKHQATTATATARQPQQTDQQKIANRVSHDALILSEPHLSFQHGCRPSSF